MATSEVLAVLHRVASAIRDRLDHLDNWGRASGHEGQYLHDVAADEVAVSMLGDTGFGVLSEESGFHGRDRPVLVVVDPVDGSTNASRGLPWWGTSLCALDGDGPFAAVVVNQVTGTRYEAARGGGARRDGKQVRPSECDEIGKAVLAFSGYPPSYLGWAQFRALGASALELCAVADGTVDGFVDWAASSLRPWDYLGALLVCAEAGAPFTEASGRDLVVAGTDVHRAPLAAATSTLLEQLARAREGRPAATNSGEGASEHRGQQKII